jgi:predicted  nucleic acid-binding Zn-ribbon protein
LVLDLLHDADVGRFRAMKGMDRLLELQEKDSALDRLRTRRTEIESGEELRRLRGAVEDSERTLGEVRLAHDAVSMEQRRLENEIDSIARKGEAEEKRLYDGTIVNVKELDALQAEIRNLKERRSRLEDDLLERMERREELDAKIATAERDVATAREALERGGADTTRELEEIVRGTSDLREQREAIAGEVDEELLELYDDLREQKKGVGVAALVDGVCQGCHQKLSAMELDRLKKLDGIRRCEYCRRILIPS